VKQLLAPPPLPPPPLPLKALKGGGAAKPAGPAKMLFKPKALKASA